MLGGKLQKVRFVYSGIDIDAILDRLPTAKDTVGGRWEVCGGSRSVWQGIDMWLRSQGKMLSEYRRTIMERNKVKIICNPYEKTIAYKRWEWDDVNGFQWKDLGSNSNLIKNKEFINATIQHNAYEIVGELSNEYIIGAILV